MSDGLFTVGPTMKASAGAPMDKDREDLTNIINYESPDQKQHVNQKLDKVLSEKDREQLKERTDKIFVALNTGMVLKFHEKSGEWYAVIENKITHKVIKEIPSKDALDLQGKLKDMIGFFLDKKI